MKGCERPKCRRNDFAKNSSRSLSLPHVRHFPLHKQGLEPEKCDEAEMNKDEKKMKMKKDCKNLKEFGQIL